MPFRRQQSQRTGGGRLRGRMTIMPWDQASENREALLQSCFGATRTRRPSKKTTLLGPEMPQLTADRICTSISILEWFCLRAIETAALLRVAWQMPQLDRCLHLLGACHCLPKPQGRGVGIWLW